MKRITIICSLVLFTTFFTGCNYLEDSNSKVLRVCRDFDESLRSDYDAMSGLTTDDFTFSYNPGYQQTYPFYNLEKTTYTLTEFINTVLIEEQFADLVADFDPSSFPVVTALFRTDTTVNMETICRYEFFGFDMAIPLLFEVSLRDTGGFLKSDWKVYSFYLSVPDTTEE